MGNKTEGSKKKQQGWEIHFFHQQWKAIKQYFDQKSNFIKVAIGRVYWQLCTDRFGFWREEENVLVVQAKGPYESEVCAMELRKEEMSANIWRKTASNCKHLLR